MVPMRFDIDTDAVVACISQLECTNGDATTIHKCLFRQLYSGVGLKAISCDVTWTPDAVTNRYRDAIRGYRHIKEWDVPCANSPGWKRGEWDGLIYAAVLF